MATNFTRRKGYQSRFDQTYISQLKEVKSKIDKGTSITKLNKEYGSDVVKQAKADLGILDKNYSKTKLIDKDYVKSRRTK